MLRGEQISTEGPIINIFTYNAVYSMFLMDYIVKLSTRDRQWAIPLLYLVNVLYTYMYINKAWPHNSTILNCHKVFCKYLNTTINVTYVRKCCLLIYFLNSAISTRKLSLFISNCPIFFRKSYFRMWHKQEKLARKFNTSFV